MGSFASANEKMAEAVGVVRDQWQALVDSGVTEAELQDAKTYLTGAYPLRFNGNSQIAAILVSMQMDDLPTDYVVTRNEKVEAVTLDEERIAKELLDPRGCVWWLRNPRAEVHELGTGQHLNKNGAVPNRSRAVFSVLGRGVTARDPHGFHFGRGLQKAFDWSRDQSKRAIVDPCALEIASRCGLDHLRQIEEEKLQTASISRCLAIVSPRSLCAPVRMFTHPQGHQMSQAPDRVGGRQREVQRRCQHHTVAHRN